MKETVNDAKVIVGGVHAEAEPEQMLRNPSIDAVCRDQITQFPVHAARLGLVTLLATAGEQRQIPSFQHVGIVTGHTGHRLTLLEAVADCQSGQLIV